MKKWHFTPIARKDLAAIWRYTAREWGTDQADSYVLKIEENLGAAADGSPLVREFKNYKRIKSGNHLCIFHEVDIGDIEVIRIMHERMDLDGTVD